jgi:DNA (cytosine-5)-methyltransferase 1
MPRCDKLGAENWPLSDNQLPSWEYFVRLKSNPGWPKAGSPIKIVDLFSGCGGLTLGATLAGTSLSRPVEVAVAADSWDEALRVYEKNFSNIVNALSQEDLSTLVDFPGSVSLSVKGKSFVKGLGHIDVLVAGPPCQGNSDLNNSSRRNDPRNQLYTVPVAVGIELGADLLVIENVPPVVHSSGKVVGDAFGALKRAGYSVCDFVANAVNFGLPQSRRRHILVASRKHNQTDLESCLSFAETGNAHPVWSFIFDLEHESPDSLGLLTQATRMSNENVARINYLFDNNLFDLPNSLRPKCHRDKTHSYVSMYGRLRKDLPSQTITSGFGSMGQGRYVHPTQRRMISAHEAARIQGFPDYFDFTTVKNITALRTIIANAVPPGLIAHILVRLLKK